MCARWLQRPEKSIGSRGIGVTNGREKLCGYRTHVIVSKKPWLSSLYRSCVSVGCIGECVQCVPVVCLWACTNLCQRVEVRGQYQMSSALHLYFLRQAFSPSLQHFHSAGVAAQWSSGIPLSLLTPYSRLGLQAHITRLSRSRGFWGFKLRSSSLADTLLTEPSPRLSLLTYFLFCYSIFIPWILNAV